MIPPCAPPPRRLSLVIPAYNEAAGIRQAIAEADAALARLTSGYEILVVDDGSSDATAAVVAEEMRHRPALRLLRHATNRGYGAALRTGFESARFERVAFTDADCQFYLDDLSTLLPLSDDCADQGRQGVAGHPEPVGPSRPIAVVTSDRLADVEHDGLNNQGSLRARRVRQKSNT